MLGLLIIAYLLGSVNSALLVCRWLSLPSPKTHGSHNPGATNVLRIGGKKAGGLTLAGDVLKGVIPVLIGHLLHLPYLSLCWIAFFAVLGHVYPLFFNFKGGKGVATAIGTSFAIHPFLGASVGLTWAVIAFVSRYSSLASICAILMLPVYGYLLLNALTIVPLGFLAVLILIKHQQNFKRLLAGTESKLGAKR